MASLSISNRRGTGKAAAGAFGLGLVRYLPCICFALIALSFAVTISLLGEDTYPVYTSAPETTNALGPRRTKAHICYSRVHAELPAHILTSPQYGFNYTRVDANKGDEWDIMLGGYPHCARGDRHHGNRWGWDWEMKYGLNKQLNEAGWDNLKPHQVYHPCMGCKLSYCNKRDMCKLIRDNVDTDLCFVLPDDEERLKEVMDGKRAWVMKEDAINVHIHTGSGVSYITKPNQLPSAEKMGKGVYMVQPWVEPYLGEGMFRRKAELRFYLAMTDVYPMRAYIHNESFVVMAAKPYTTTADAIADKCVHDTHSGNHKCDKFVSKEFENAIRLLLVQNRALQFDDYANFVGLSQPKRQKIIKDAHELISTVIKAGHYALEEHHINKGIDKSGAMCFSHYRVDMGIREDGQPFIYEMAEFPGLYGVGRSVEQGLHGKNSVEELFRMIGLDAPPVPKEERAEYERIHLGGWLPLAEL